MTRLKAIFLPVLAVGLAGCVASSTPSAPSPSVQINTPALALLSSVSGTVSDTAFRPIAGAQVEIVDGPQAGTVTTADATGRFSLSGPFDRATRFRATQKDHAGVVQVPYAYCDQDLCYGSVAFYLAAFEPPVNISGDYSLDVVVDSACAGFPDDLTTRTYTATIASTSDPSVPANTSLNVTLTGPPFLGHYKTFRIGVVGDYLAFFLNGGESASVVEQLSGNRYFAFSGAGATTAAAGTRSISIPFDGWIGTARQNHQWAQSTGVGSPTARASSFPMNDSRSSSARLANTR